MKTRILSLTSVLLLAVTSQTQALEFSVAAGGTGHGDPVLRAGLTSDWQHQWFASDTGQLSGYWDTGYTYWSSGRHSAAAHSLSLAPVFTYTFNRPVLKPFIEGGIGVAVFSKTRVNGRKLGSSLNFEDRIGAGIQLPNNGKLGIRAIHYSNAGLKNPNDGVDNYSLFYRHPL
ncbi:acyloxyacyl hydrolase [Thiopseudomonas denitrificans]|uniref:Lipid A deacylase n=1 Tax=Thiopseudomonas denitrificans TaxID=1501432 RepID=A0A4R6TX76_9GAMM|nr:acyloxyacyl hydrolase [Thiopseudomonas denitrificans]TDQ38490.1 lipid A 3-O-deacylase [Thiopseudomonas denitrificans]